MNLSKTTRTTAGILSICLTIALATGCNPFKTDLSHDVVHGSESAYQTNLSPGTNAKELLTPDHFRSLQVEVQAVQGQQPSQEAINALYDFLKKYAKKPAGIQILPVETIPVPAHPAAQSGYTLQDVHQIEDANRKHYTKRGTLVLYVLFLDWNSNDDAGNDKMLGQAYSNSSVVIYKGTLKGLTPATSPTTPPTPNTSLDPSPLQQLLPAPQLNPWVMEATAVMHEFGHLLGLVNLDEKASAHEDPNHRRHCKNPQCLMYYAAESSAALSQMGGQTLPTLDADCEQDLKNLSAQ